LKLNPKGEIPVLEIDGHLFTQSIAIIEYLDETRIHKPHLLPKDPCKRAKARAIAEIVNSGMQPYQNTVTKNLKTNTETLRF
jgi:glutathione S-transferase